jgi:hypothetical protein
MNIIILVQWAFFFVIVGGSILLAIDEVRQLRRRGRS